MAEQSFPTNLWDDFDERVDQVKHLLDDEGFVEHLNTTFIVDSRVDGQREYKKFEIEMGREAMIDAQKEDLLLDF
ncbi:MAG: hypothetical protein UU16_C0003G0023 [Candidatus Woesebacteria bacterium GW2011_GWA2_40_7]|uniref:Uncharacterized protein n=3 Tax=Candidatus Woeseibacteriota TaxID=1752722 RepID=A0A0G0XXK6_9BACT|nr:MAG: hypothetical protein UT17_C0002G0012 [Candidatus Woesebacteria bacterium GW2011_GWB1_39_10]KKR74262.1 MAG: hypothetical protein UU16_C0003G0023 [Candidatus Woesebacteria bacterium GW2011_GWA2_40_7]KKR92637.1 MAG: hypothetical protein UU42_C0001G0241 [Candidatus Woesebacteria bacterium GW2011_GWA1_41_13b]